MEPTTPALPGNRSGRSRRWGRSGRSRRRSAALAVLVTTGLLVGLVPAAGARVADVPTPGADGIGDAYFPLDGNGGIDVRRYEVHDAYDFDTGRLGGWTELTMRATQDLSRFNLDLLLPVRKVKVDGVEADFTKPVQHELQITPARPITAGSKVKVLVRYRGTPGAIEYAGERNWLANEGEVVTMNEPHMAPWWFPANDHPLDKAKMDIHITVPVGTSVVANGRLVSRTVEGRRATTRWRAQDPMVPYLAFFAAGRFQTAKGTYQGLPWYAAVSRQLPPAVRARSMALMKRSPRITAWTARQLGDYPFEATGGLTTGLTVGFALENQTRPTYPVLGRNAVLVVAHEISHQWFGDSVSVQGWRDIWLNEGAATFMEARYTETHGGESARAWLDRSYAAYVGDPGFWEVPIDDPGAEAIFSDPVYTRGGMTLQALRQRIGEDAYWALLRTWVADRAGGNGSTPQFVALAEEISGQDLDSFFQAWLRDPRPPAKTPANGF